MQRILATPKRRLLLSTQHLGPDSSAAQASNATCYKNGAHLSSTKPSSFLTPNVTSWFAKAGLGLEKQSSYHMSRFVKTQVSSCAQKHTHQLPLRGRKRHNMTGGCGGGVKKVQAEGRINLPVILCSLKGLASHASN